MSGVGLVGYSGSLIKDAVKESIVHNLARALGLYTDPNATLADEPEVTKVLVGTFLPRHLASCVPNPSFHRHILRFVCAGVVSAQYTHDDSSSEYKP
jgi:hypothetical protein